MRKDLQNVEALTFDPISRLLYWVDAGARKIEVQSVAQVQSLFVVGPEFFWTDSLDTGHSNKIKK